MTGSVVVVSAFYASCLPKQPARTIVMVFGGDDLLDAVVAVFTKQIDETLLALLASRADYTVAILLSMPD